MDSTYPVIGSNASNFQPNLGRLILNRLQCMLSRSRSTFRLFMMIIHDQASCASERNCNKCQLIITVFTVTSGPFKCTPVANAIVNLIGLQQFTTTILSKWLLKEMQSNYLGSIFNSKSVQAIVRLFKLDGSQDGNIFHFAITVSPPPPSSHFQALSVSLSCF